MIWLVLYLVCFCLPLLIYVIRHERASWKRWDEHWDEVSGRKRRQ